jgi:hypothetical protein
MNFDTPQISDEEKRLLENLKPFEKIKPTENETKLLGLARELDRREIFRIVAAVQYGRVKGIDVGDVGITSILEDHENKPVKAVKETVAKAYDALNHSAILSEADFEVVLGLARRMEREENY